jgi:anti-sigma regulatory factor (Ser/Thr protein kinase)
MNLGHEVAPSITDGVEPDDRGAAMVRRNVDWARALERQHLRARLRAVIVPGLEELVDPGADPATLITLADRHARRLRVDLEGAVPAAPPDDGPSMGIRAPVWAAREEERAWVRGHLHDTALQILEFIAGDGFGTGLSAAKISRLAGGAARDLRRWIDAAEAPVQLVPALEAVTSEARRFDPNIRLVVGSVETAPTGEEATALVGAVREALTNARKHAQCSEVVVHVESGADGRTAVTVTDDGVGFDAERVAGATGLGVRGSIVGRMTRVGGHASLQRAPEGGTRVTLVTSTEDTSS